MGFTRTLRGLSLTSEGIEAYDNCLLITKKYDDCMQNINFQTNLDHF